MSVTRHAVKSGPLKKIKTKPAWVLAPLESGQLEMWYFHLGARKGILPGRRTLLSFFPLAGPL